MFDPINDPSFYIEVFNTGARQLDFEVTSEENWIRLSTAPGFVRYDERILVNIHEGETVPDWEYPDGWNETVTDRVRKSHT